MPGALLHVVPFVDRCHRYVIDVFPPLAGVVDVNAAGVEPEQRVWSEPIVPGFTVAMVIATVLVYVILPSASIAARW